jgi:hypothetical protein
MVIMVITLLLHRFPSYMFPPYIIVVTRLCCLVFVVIVLLPHMFPPYILRMVTQPPSDP